MPQYTPPTTATVSRPKAKGYDASIGDLLVRLWPSDGQPLVIATAPVATELVATAANPEDFAEPPEVRTFSRNDFTGGEGLERAHQRDSEPRDLTRFWASKGVDIRRRADEPLEVRLLHDVETAVTDTSVGAVATDGASLWWASGVDVKRTDNPLASPPSTAVEDPHDGEGDVTVLDLAMLGDELYAALGANGIHRRSNLGVWSHWSDLAAVRLWAVKDRIVASTGTELYEAAAAAASTLLKAVPSGVSWTSVVDAGEAVLAAAASEVYAFALSGTPPVLTEAAQTPFLGETVTALGAGQGFVFVATTTPTRVSGTIARLWRAELTDGLTLGAAQVLRVWGDPDTTLVRSPSPIYVTRDHAFVALDAPGSEVHVWRYDFATEAMSRDLVYGAGSITDLLVIEERQFAARSGVGVDREADEYVDSGYLILPLVDFYTARDKLWSSVTAWTSNLGVNSEEIRLDTTDDVAALTDATSTAWAQAASIAEGTGGTPVTLAGKQGRWLAVKVTLYASADNAVTPGLQALSLSAFPGVDEQLFRLPVNVSDHFDRPRHARVLVPNSGHRTFEQLRNLEGTPQVVELFWPELRIRGTVLRVETPISVASARGSSTLVSNVTIRGRKEAVGGGGIEASAKTFGRGLWGKMHFGGDP